MFYAIALDNKTKCSRDKMKKEHQIVIFNKWTLKRSKRSQLKKLTCSDKEKKTKQKNEEKETTITTTKNYLKFAQYKP